MPAHVTDLRDYARAMVEETPGFAHRLLVHGLPMRFHEASQADRRRILRQRPRLTGTKWDAFLAAVVEHIAQLHGLEPPAWIDEPGRFLAPPWVHPKGKLARAEALVYSPGAFIRNGVLIDPTDLGWRGGEKHEWVPAARREADSSRT